MKILSFYISLLMTCTSANAAEMVIHNLTRNIEASNSLYDSINVYPGDRVEMQVNQLKYTTADTFLWYIEGQDVIKTEKPCLEYTIENSPGWKKIVVLAMDKKSKIDGSSFKMFVGSFEAPSVTLEEGAKRPGCPLIVRANVLPYSYAVVPSDLINEYNWKVVKDGKVLSEYTTNTNELEFFLPQDSGLVHLIVSATDANCTQSPETLFPIQVKPW